MLTCKKCGGWRQSINGNLCGECQGTGIAVRRSSPRPPIVCTGPGSSDPKTAPAVFHAVEKAVALERERIATQLERRAGELRIEAEKIRDRTRDDESLMRITGAWEADAAADELENAAKQIREGRE